MSLSTLPDWRGADRAYARAQRVLRRMVEAGHVTVVRNGRGRPVRSVPSAEMTELVSAMNRGAEPAIRALLARHRHLGDR